VIPAIGQNIQLRQPILLTRAFRFHALNATCLRLYAGDASLKNRVSKYFSPFM
jgi:hypothetical protein